MLGSVPRLISALSVSVLVKGCPQLRVLDLSNSCFDDDMAGLLCGCLRLIKKGDLVKIVQCKETNNQPLFRNLLAILDLRNTKVGFRGLATVKDSFPSKLRVLR